MNFSTDSKELRMKNLVCDRYITIDSKGEIDFKSTLKDAINENKISINDAILISFELMYGVNNLGFNNENIPIKLDNLIFIKTKSKKSRVFSKNYSFERQVLFDYLKSLRSKKQTKNKINKESIEVNEEPIENKSKEFEAYLNDLSKEELCYILDIDPNLTFEKKKIFKKQIVDKYSEYTIDVDKLKKGSYKRC